MRSRHFDVKLRLTRVIARVECSRGRGSCLPRILASMCHAAIVINRQNVKIGKHHSLVDGTAHKNSRVRCVAADATDELRGPDQHWHHVGATFGWPPQFHPVGHARRNTRPQDKQCFRRTLRRTGSHRCSAAHPLPQPPLDSRRSPKYITRSAVGRRLSPHQSSGAPSRALPGPPTSTVWQPVPLTTGLGATGLACPAAQGQQRLHTAAATGGTLVRHGVAPQKLGRGLTQPAPCWMPTST